MFGLQRKYYHSSYCQHISYFHTSIDSYYFYYTISYYHTGHIFLVFCHWMLNLEIIPELHVLPT